MARSFKTAMIVLFVTASLYGAEKKTVLVVYHSVQGHTQKMAESVAEGTGSVEGVSVILKPIGEVKKEELLKADGLIIGSPVYNGNVHPKVMTFINGWPFHNQPMKDKIGAAFVTAGGFSAGEEMAMMNMIHAMMVNGMIITGGSDWKSAFGVSGIVAEAPYFTEDVRGKVDPYFLKKGFALGKRVADLVLRFEESGKQ